MEFLHSSLLDLVKCPICYEQKEDHKTLQCQHTLCFVCLQQLPIQDCRVKCPICSKITVVPDGGIRELPDSEMTKQLQMLMKKKEEEKPPSRLTKKEKKEKLKTLRNLVERESEACNKWLREMERYTCSYKILKEKIRKGTEQSSDILKNFLEESSKFWAQKEKWLKDGQSDNSKEINTLTTDADRHAEQVKDAIKSSKLALNALKKKNVTDEDMKTAECEMKKLKCRRSSNPYYLGKTFYTGATVRLFNTISEEEANQLDCVQFLFNQVPPTSVGVVQRVVRVEHRTPLMPLIPIIEEKLWVVFPEKPDWTGDPEQLLPTSERSSALQVGDSVCLKDDQMIERHGRLVKLSKKSVGILRKLDIKGCPDGDLFVTIDFSECKGWKGLYSYIEKAPGCGFRIGDEVRVNHQIEEPSRGWSGVNGSSVGTITNITGSVGEEEITVRFPECEEWIGVAEDLEHQRGLLDNDIHFVQVKLSVTEPRKGWNGVTHDKIGVLNHIQLDAGTNEHIASVYFINEKNWHCFLDELEPRRYMRKSEFEKQVNDLVEMQLE